MKKLLNILMIILIYFIFCGKSCEDDSAPAPWQQRQAELAKDTLRVEFETDYLSEEARHAAEINAIQKLHDLADYVEVFSDQSLDSAFREKAGEMIGEMFISQDNLLLFMLDSKGKMKQVTLEEFLEKGFGGNYLKAEVNFDSILVTKPLEKSGAELYSGKLAAFQTVVLHSSGKSTNSYSLLVINNFISFRQIKVIGQDTLKVWKVSLGNFDGTIKNLF